MVEAVAGLAVGEHCSDGLGGLGRMTEVASGRISRRIELRGDAGDEGLEVGAAGAEVGVLAFEGPRWLLDGVVLGGRE